MRVSFSGGGAVKLINVDSEKGSRFTSDLAVEPPTLDSASRSSNADFTQSNGILRAVWVKMSGIDVQTSHLANEWHLGTTVARTVIIKLMRDGEEGLRVTVPHNV